MSKSPVHVEVVLRKDESLERLIRRFLKKVKKDGILKRVNEYRYYKKPSEKRLEQEKIRQRVLKKLREENGD